MRRLSLVLIVIFLIALPGCSGCDKKDEQPVVKRARPERVAPAVKPRPPSREKEIEEEVTPEPQVKMDSKDSKKKVLAIMPDVVETFQSPEFKKKMQQSAKSRDIKEFMQTMQGVLAESCRKQGLSLEECMKLMNEYKDDPEVQSTLKELRDSFEFPQ